MGYTTLSIGSWGSVQIGAINTGSAGLIFGAINLSSAGSYVFVGTGTLASTFNPLSLSSNAIFGAKTLILFFGQSNSQPHGPITNLSSTLLSYTASYTNVQITASESASPTDPPVWEVFSGSLAPMNFGGALKLGFEASSLRTLDRVNPTRFAFGGYSIGGSAVAQWGPLSTYPASTSPPNLASSSVVFVQNVMTALSCTELVMVWDQGEADSKSSANANAYGQFLIDHFTQMRNALGKIGPGGKTIPAVIGQLNADADSATYGFKDTTRYWQANYCATASNSATLVNRDQINQASGWFDGTHYNANGYILGGNLYAAAIANACGINVLPVASLDADTSNGLTASFTSTSVSYGGAITSLSWSFGDGSSTSSLSPVLHAYAVSGTYSVTVKATNVNGDSDTSVIASVSVIDGITGVIRDALSKKYAPGSYAQWQAFLTGSSLTTLPGGGVPDMGHSFQDVINTSAAGGYPIDFISNNALTCSINTSTFQSVTGWVRKSMNVTDGSARQIVSVNSALPDLSSTSMLTISYILFPSSAPAADRGIIAQGTSASTRSAVILKSTGKTATESTTSNVNIGTGSPCDGLVHPVAIKVNRTGAACVGYTDIDKMTPTFGTAMTGSGLYLGAETGALAAAAEGFLYEVSWFGSKAEMTDAQVKSLLQALGFTITWT
jgi:PKD repeat protein